MQFSIASKMNCLYVFSMFFSLIFPVLQCIIKVGWGRTPSAPFVGLGSCFRGWGCYPFLLCFDFAVSNDLRGICCIFCRGFDQLGDVFEILVKFRTAHFIHFLTSFLKRFTLCPATIKLYFNEVYMSTLFSENSKNFINKKAGGHPAISILMMRSKRFLSVHFAANSESSARWASSSKSSSMYYVFLPVLD